MREADGIGPDSQKEKKPTTPEDTGGEQPPPRELYLIVGLGNPGPQYSRNRHNLGFQILDVLAGRHGLSFNQARYKSLIAEGRIASKPVLLVKPMTYMNLSGEAVGPIVRAYQVPPERLLIVYDDMDLPPGKLRLRSKGGSGGHRGLESVIRALGTNEFPRLRVGIGRPPGKMSPVEYVLQNFSPEEEEIMAVAREEAADAIETWLTEGIHKAMDRFN